jgi:hypothetical protein
VFEITELTGRSAGDRESSEGNRVLDEGKAILMRIERRSANLDEEEPPWTLIPLLRRLVRAADSGSSSPS